MFNPLAQPPEPQTILLLVWQRDSSFECLSEIERATVRVTARIFSADRIGNDRLFPWLHGWRNVMIRPDEIDRAHQQDEIQAITRWTDPLAMTLRYRG